MLDILFAGIEVPSRFVKHMNKIREFGLTLGRATFWGSIQSQGFNTQKSIKPSSTERLIDERLPVLQMVLEEIGDVLINHLISFFI